MKRTYTLLSGSTTFELNSKVNEYLNDGWKLTGIAICAIAIQTVKDHPEEGNPYTVFTQTVIRS